MSKSIFDSDHDSGSGSESENEEPMPEEHLDDSMSEDEPEDEPMEEPERTSADMQNQSTTRPINPKYRDHLKGKPFLRLATVRRYLKETYPHRISRNATAALIGVTQGLIIELIEEVRGQVLKGKTKRVSAKTICMAIQRDVEFSELLSNVFIPASGVFGMIGTGSHPH